MKTRRHSNNKGYRSIKNGTVARQVEQMALRMKLSDISKRFFYDHIILGFGPYEDIDLKHLDCPICERVRKKICQK